MMTKKSKKQLSKRARKILREAGLSDDIFYFGTKKDYYSGNKKW